MKLCMFLFLPSFIKIKNTKLFYYRERFDVYSIENKTNDSNSILNRSGVDERHVQNITLEKEELYNLYSIFNKMDTLTKLTSNLTSPSEKYKISSEVLDLFSYDVNMTAGGLFDDWDFKI